MSDDNPGKKWVVRIDRWHPPRLNQWDGRHWSARSRMKKHATQIIGYSCLGAAVPRADCCRRIGLTIVLGRGQRGGDPDAYHKATLDALVSTGFLVNDSKEWVIVEPTRYERGASPATIICIENVPVRMDSLTPCLSTGPRQGRRRPVIHLRTGTVYSTIRLAAAAAGVSPGWMSVALQQGCLINGDRWGFVNQKES